MTGWKAARKCLFPTHSGRLRRFLLDPVSPILPAQDSSEALARWPPAQICQQQGAILSILFILSAHRATGACPITRSPWRAPAARQGRGCRYKPPRTRTWFFARPSAGTAAIPRCASDESRNGRQLSPPRAQRAGRVSGCSRWFESRQPRTRAGAVSRPRDNPHTRSRAAPRSGR